MSRRLFAFASLAASLAAIAITPSAALAQPVAALAAPAAPLSLTPSATAPTAAIEDDDAQLPPRLRRQVVDYPSKEPPGTIIVDTPHTYLYYVLGNGKALRYGIGVGRQGFTWSGVNAVTRKAEWPDWYPPAAMIKRQPYLPRMTAGGPGNPLGARALYIGHTEYRIHGTNNPATIGKHVSSGCIRLTNEDIIDLFNRANVGAKVIVLPQTMEARTKAPAHRAPAVEEVAGSNAYAAEPALRVRAPR